MPCTGTALSSTLAGTAVTRFSHLKERDVDMVRYVAFTHEFIKVFPSKNISIYIISQLEASTDCLFLQFVSEVLNSLQ